VLELPRWTSKPHSQFQAGRPRRRRNDRPDQPPGGFGQCRSHDASNKGERSGQEQRPAPAMGVGMISRRPDRRERNASSEEKTIIQPTNFPRVFVRATILQVRWGQSSFRQPTKNHVKKFKKANTPSVSDNPRPAEKTDQNKCEEDCLLSTRYDPRQTHKWQAHR